MKSYYDWFDDEWNPDVIPRRVVLELLLSPIYRLPKRVTEVHIYKEHNCFSVCPRCKATMEYEYQLFCGRCRQRLNLAELDDAKEVFVGWNGIEDEEDD